jgi:hypothetical protein
MSRITFAALALGAACAALPGCGGGNTVPPAVDHLRHLARYYGMYQSRHQGRTPPDEKEFKDFIRKVDPGAKVEEIFTSPRDHEAYVVRYKQQKLAPPDPTKGAAIIAYEKTGVDGKHMVARSTTEVDEIDAAKLKELIR